jgi:hypothetical protein
MRMIRFLPLYQFAGRHKKITHLIVLRRFWQMHAGRDVSRYYGDGDSEQKLMVSPYQLYAVQAIVDHSPNVATAISAHHRQRKR